MRARRKLSAQALRDMAVRRIANAARPSRQHLFFLVLGFSILARSCEAMVLAFKICVVVAPSHCFRVLARLPRDRAPSIDL
jgi:hypothetical protein